MPRVVPSQVVALIDQYFPWSSDESTEQQNKAYLSMGHMREVAAVVDATRQIPSELITVEGAQYAKLQASIIALQTSVETWQARGDVQTLIRLTNDRYHPVTWIRKILSQCPDESPSPSVSGLEFIEDEELRESLRLDLSSAYSAHSNGEWKASTVMAGAVVEALLYWRLKHSPDLERNVKKLIEKKVLTHNPGNDLDHWHLAEFIEVSEALQKISTETAQQVRLAKDFRNLIHPGREARLKQKCDRATSLTALAAVEHVIRNFSTKP